MFGVATYAQVRDKADRPPEKSFKERIYYGGNLGLQFGNITLVEFAPSVGYKLTDNLSLGVGATYLYISYNDLGYKFTSNIYGARIFGRYIVSEGWFIHGEDEVLNVESVYFPGTRLSINTYMAGVGYRQMFSDRSSYYIIALWNFNESVYSPYSNPIIRMGFNVGF